MMMMIWDDKNTDGKTNEDKDNSKVYNDEDDYDDLNVDADNDCIKMMMMMRMTMMIMRMTTMMIMRMRMTMSFLPVVCTVQLNVTATVYDGSTSWSGRAEADKVLPAAEGRAQEDWRYQFQEGPSWDGE